MQTHWVFIDCGEGLKARLQAYWEKKQLRLEKLLRPFRPELRELRLTVYRHEQPHRWEVRGVLHLPTGTLAAEETDADYKPVLDRVADILVREIKRHKERLRRDYVYRRKNRRREELIAASPMLERDATQGRRQAFFDLLQPLLRSLHEHARHELRILELEDILPRGETTAADMVDEVLTRAWQQFATRPSQRPLDLWLIDLLHDVVDQWRQQPPPVAMAAESRQQAKPDKEKEEEWWRELLEETEPLAMEELVPSGNGGEVWERLEMEEQRKWLLQLLAALPASRRQAFVLHALEGFDTAEIAMVQDRPEAEVKSDIEAARQTLRSRLAEVGIQGTTAVIRETAGGPNLLREI
ncbi:MAG: sigma factor-like helix-turn-helix DNA-binding protein [Gemmataceae bacterium]